MTAGGSGLLWFYLSLYSHIYTRLFRYKEIRYPENTEKLVIHNNSGLEAEVQFAFQHDTQASTYLLEPPTMTLTPGQKQVPQHQLLIELIIHWITDCV